MNQFAEYQGQHSNQTTDKQRECFRASKDLQNEFGNDEDAYLAFIEAEKEGRAGIIGGVTVSQNG